MLSSRVCMQKRGALLRWHALGTSAARLVPCVMGCFFLRTPVVGNPLGVGLTQVAPPECSVVWRQWRLSGKGLASALPTFTVLWPRDHQRWNPPEEDRVPVRCLHMAEPPESPAQIIGGGGGWDQYILCRGHGGRAWGGWGCINRDRGGARHEIPDVASGQEMPDWGMTSLR